MASKQKGYKMNNSRITAQTPINDLYNELIINAIEGNLLTKDMVYNCDDNIESLFIEFCITNQGLAVMNVSTTAQYQDIDETCEALIGWNDIYDICIDHFEKRPPAREVA